MRKCLITFLILFCISFSHAYANSYLDMITKPPAEQYIAESAPPEVVSPKPNAVNYYSFAPQNIPATTSPAIIPSAEEQKYQAWLQSQANTPTDSAFSQETIQNMIYTLETGLLGLGLYEIYRYK